MSNASSRRNSFLNYLKGIYVPINYKGKRPYDVYERLSKMREKAEIAKLQGDEQQAYIFLKRWVDSVEWLKKQKYKDNKNDMTANQIFEVKKVLANLEQKLQKKYEEEKLLEEIDGVEHPQSNVDQSPPSADIFLSLPETPTDDPLNSSETDDFISCNQLFQWIHKSDNNILIIDIRSKNEYFASRMMCNTCINIPSSEIRQGISAISLEKYLQEDKQSLDMFKRRGYVDTVVLLDLNTTQTSFTNCNQLNTLKKILIHWDHSAKCKKIVTLDGGYSEWLIHYPTYVSDPNVTLSIPNNEEVMMEEILEDIQYPDDHSYSDDEDSISRATPNKLKMFKPANQSDANLRMDIPDNSPILKQKTRIGIGSVTPYGQSKNILNSSLNFPNENKLKPYWNNIYEVPFKNGEHTPENKKILSTISINNTIKKPSFDRSNKPSSLKTNSEARTMLKLMKELNELAKGKEKLEDDILQFEHSLYNQRNLLYKDGTEEKNIHTTITKYCSELAEKDKLYKQMEEELSKYKKDRIVNYNSVEKSVKDKLELSLETTRRRIKTIAAERKRLQERSVLNEHKKLSIKQEGNESYKEPVKFDGPSNTGGLERSYSSPNLLQVRERKLPQVDRSCKPQALRYGEDTSANNNTIKNIHFSWANREERMNPIHGNVHPGITGLKNIGNSCYMNSIIQCLSNTPRLTKYFNDDLYVDDLNKNKENITQCQVVEEVALVIKALWRGQYKSISPLDLKAAIGQYKMQFESYDQQDSHEFLTFLLDWMHNDLKKKSESRNRLTIAGKEWDKAMNCQRSIISDLFFGQLRSTITCASCNEASTTYETFNSLTMSLPYSSKCTLHDCIQKFVSGQKVSGWKCPNCKVPREATKKFDFVKLAPIIVIHLNRFAESGGWLEKRNTAVDFPLTGFNLKPYLVIDNDASSAPCSYSYSLYAMSNHFGTMEGGHYTAYCKNAIQNKWYKYDDQTVTETNSNQVKSQTASAYLLFYTSYSNEPYPFI